MLCRGLTCAADDVKHSLSLCETSHAHLMPLKQAVVGSQPDCRVEQEMVTELKPESNEHAAGLPEAYESDQL